MGTEFTLIPRVTMQCSLILTFVFFKEKNNNMKERRSLKLFGSFSVAIPIQTAILKRKKKNVHINFQPVKFFSLFFCWKSGRERVCMVYVNIVG